MKSPKAQTASAADRALQLAHQIRAKKGFNLIVFDLRELSPITDYFVIADGYSEVHTRTIAEYLITDARPAHVERLDTGQWVLIDFIDVIVHLFVSETRRFYGLERLWGDAPRLALADDQD